MQWPHSTTPFRLLGIGYTAVGLDWLSSDAEEQNNSLRHLSLRIDVSQTSCCSLAAAGCATWKAASTHRQTFYTISAFSFGVESMYTRGVRLTTVKCWATLMSTHTCWEQHSAFSNTGLHYRTRFQYGHAVRSESRCAIIKGLASDVQESVPSKHFQQICVRRVAVYL
jgi:hypothetical protein